MNREEIHREVDRWLDELEDQVSWLQPHHVVAALRKLATAHELFMPQSHGRGRGVGFGGAHVEIERGEDGSLWPAVWAQSHDGRKRFRYDIRDRKWVGVHRDVVERELGAWPGFADGIEAAADAAWCVVEHARRVVDQGRAQAAAFQREYRETVTESVFRQFALGRHRELERWRWENPVASAEVPMVLRGIRHVKRMETVHPCYVYFLLKEGEVVYVGQTTTAWPGRIATHVNDPSKDFDDVWCLEVDGPSLNEVEAAMIRRFEPKYNRRIP